MSTMTKVFVVLNAVAALVLSVQAISFATQTANFQESYRVAIAERDAAIAQRDSAAAAHAQAIAMLENDNVALKQNKETLEQRLSDLQADLGQFERRAAEATNRATLAEVGRTQLQANVEALTTLLKTKTAQEAQLESDNDIYQQRVSEQNQRILTLTSQVTIKDEQVRNLQEKLSACETGAGPIAAAPDRVTQVRAFGDLTAASRPSVGPIRGEVVDSDGTYVSINVGESSGVQAGMRFMVYRGPDYLGDVEISQVRPNEAGGRIVIKDGDIRAGDRVDLSPDSM